MGCKPAPDVANIFMAIQDQLIMKVTDGLFEHELRIKYFKRFLDDIIIIFKGNNKELHLWLAGLHLNIKYTIKHNKVITDLYKKPTDRNMYLLPSSSHVASVSQNIFLV